jgi:hypothetical protein
MHWGVALRSRCSVFLVGSTYFLLAQTTRLVAFLAVLYRDLDSDCPNVRNGQTVRDRILGESHPTF